MKTPVWVFTKMRIGERMIPNNTNEKNRNLNHSNVKSVYHLTSECFAAQLHRSLSILSQIIDRVGATKRHIGKVWEKRYG